MIFSDLHVKFNLLKIPYIWSYFYELLYVSKFFIVKLTIYYKVVYLYGVK